MKKDIIISLCDYTGIMVRPWLDDGYTCILVDPQHPKGITKDGDLIKIGEKVEDCLDVLSQTILSGRVKMVFGFPETSIVLCSMETEGMGFTPTRTTMSSPLDMPASIPPALFVKNLSGVIGSLF